MFLNLLMFKEEIIKTLSKELRKPQKEIRPLIEIPPDSSLGDYAFPCFSLATLKKKSPVEIASEIAGKLKPTARIEKIENKGPYVNFFINKKKMAEKIVKIKDSYGKGKSKKKIMVEFLSPNTNKPLHLGHLRNIVIGESVSRILEFSGNKVIRSVLYNDRGVHICKSMTAYKLYGEDKDPDIEERKQDHFVGDFYVLYSQKLKKNPKLEEENKKCLQNWEKGDPETISLWKKMNGWAYNGFKQTYDLFGISFDKEYHESDIYKKGKEIIKEGLKKKIFTKKGKAVVINLGKVGKEDLGEKILLRSDGTSVYITQDIALAKIKDEEFKLKGSIYVTGNEQIYHFKVLFEILKRLKFKFSNNLHHLYHGMVEVPEGKLKSREGKTVDADYIIAQTNNLAIEELKKRYTLPHKVYEERGLKIALSAIKYNLLKTDIMKNLLFNPSEAISFEGDTGPYLQYSYARASSILKKAGLPKKLEINLLPAEVQLIKKLDKFPETVDNAASSLNPSLVANYALQLAHSFNEFYHSCPVIGDENEAFRLELVKVFRIVMRNTLYLLGIEAIEEM